MSKIVIIGASSGIGLATSQLLSQENHEVYGTYFKTVSNSGTSNTHHNYLDITDTNPDFSFLPDTIDGLVYCPGTILLKPFKRISPETFSEDYNLQLVGAVKAIQHIVPKMKNSTQASIVLFSTVAVQTGFNFHSIVSASKGAVEGLTKALAAEFAPQIRVNCIAPSLTDTPLAEKLLGTEEKKATNAQRHPLKRFGRASDIANMVSFLLSEKSSWISGQVLHVDGGMSTLMG
jgi:NAD(P)-dependent dehydrogenase (short-subunit alcohol dehydrogenase family)